MRTILGYKLKAQKFFDTISSTLNEIVEACTPADSELSTSTLSVNINKVQHAGTKIHAKLMILSHEPKEEIAKIKAVHLFTSPV